ncbi:hypothetical protein LTR41_007410 [Exophiala xenobiotica]|nr:hypothetical protein LTR41_007410 [Exophiala xenobiotica]
MKTTQLMMLAVAALGFTSEVMAQKGGNKNTNNAANQGGNNANAGNANAGNANAGTAANATATAAASNNAGGNAGGNAADLALNPANVQTGSQQVGNLSVAGTAASATDNANFINICTGKTLTNGKQVTGGSCNGITMGDIPSNQDMISAVVLFPGPGQDIAANTAFTIQVQLQNLVAGSFTDAQSTYYSAPQALQGGQVVGHCHVTVQDLGGTLAPTSPPDPKVFNFFKGINDDGNGQGLLTADVADGLPAGFYRVCTMNSASNHQPVLMPVAQRGAQDDCQKFTVGQGTGNAAASGGNNANAGGNAAATASADASAATAASNSTAAATGAASGGNANAGGNTGGGNTGGKTGGKGGRGRFGRGRFAARDFIQ